MSTLKDVCLAEGVSKATVSRVINNHPSVNPQTRARVLEAMRKLNYTPSVAARNLSLQRSQLIGVVLPGDAKDFSPRLLQGIDHAARKAGYSLLVSFSNGEGDLIRVLRQHHERRVDGLLLVQTSMKQEDYTMVRSHNIPIVSILGASSWPEMASVTVDAQVGGEEVTQHLLSQGHKRILVMEPSGGSSETAARMEGYRETIRKSGATVDEDLLIQVYHSPEDAVAKVMLRLESACPPDAIFASDDAMALRILRLCPNPVAMAGFGGQPGADAAGLTTWEFPFEAMGEMGVELLMDKMGDHRQRPDHQAKLKGTLVVRGSSK